MIYFIDQCRDRFGVEPICRYLPIAPSTYYKHKSNEREPNRRSARAKQDDELKVKIKRVWHENNEVYGVKFGVSYTVKRLRLYGGAIDA